MEKKTNPKTGLKGSAISQFIQDRTSTIIAKSRLSIMEDTISPDNIKIIQDSLFDILHVIVTITPNKYDDLALKVLEMIVLRSRD